MKEEKDRRSIEIGCTGKNDCEDIACDENPQRCSYICTIQDLPFCQVTIRMQTYQKIYTPAEGMRRGTLFAQLYQPMERKDQNVQCEADDNTTKGPLDKIYALGLAMVDLNLYLDTHPGDERAQRDCDKLIKQLSAVKRDYEQQYGPLINFGNSPCAPGRCWVDNPWPWQNEEE